MIDGLKKCGDSLYLIGAILFPQKLMFDNINVKSKSKHKRYLENNRILRGIRKVKDKIYKFKDNPLGIANSMEWGIIFSDSLNGGLGAYEIANPYNSK